MFVGPAALDVPLQTSPRLTRDADGTVSVLKGRLLSTRKLVLYLVFHQPQSANRARLGYCWLWGQKSSPRSLFACFHCAHLTLIHPERLPEI